MPALWGRATVRRTMWFPDRRIQRDLRHAGFADSEVRAVRESPPMWAQLTAFYRADGRIERVEAAFSGATGQPGLIRFFSPPAPAVCTHASYGALAHELGHALQFPPQWQPPGAFDSAPAYARARELGEAHAWLNQYRLVRAKQGGAPETQQLQLIENDADFATQPVDLFARIAEREAAGWSDAEILDELAVLNANMFPCGMGEGNFKTYGQCNRWDWWQATQARHPAFRDFLQRLPRAPNANDQKVLMKFNLLSAPASADAQALARWADALGGCGPQGGLDALYALSCAALPGARPGVGAGAIQSSKSA